MGIIASVAAFFGQKSRPTPQSDAPEAYKSASAAELAERALAGDKQAEAALRRRAETEEGK